MTSALLALQYLVHPPLCLYIEIVPYSAVVHTISSFTSRSEWLLAKLRTLPTLSEHHEVGLTSRHLPSVLHICTDRINCQRDALDGALPTQAALPPCLQILCTHPSSNRWQRPAVIHSTELHAGCPSAPFSSALLGVAHDLT